jgi:hypothetical protein
MTLSYDCTFLALFLLGLQSDCTGFHKGRCVFNPLKKCTFCTTHTDVLQLPAALSVLSMYHKLRDDVEDAGFWKKVRARCLLPLAIRPYRKAKQDYPALAEALAEMTAAQREAEHSDAISLDSCAEPTAKMLSTVFSSVAQSPSQQRTYETIGYFLGKWIYIMDAADDLADDLQKGDFNPLIVIHQLSKDTPDEQLQAVRAECNATLNMCLSQAIAALNLIEFHHFASIIQNVVMKGLPEMQRTLLFEKKEKST